jgi:hypothetical protein
MRRSSEITAAVVGSLLLSLSVGTYAQQSAPAPKGRLEANCNDLKAQSKSECLKVATQMEQSAANGDATANSSELKTDPGYVNHSSPIMETKEEKAVRDAVKKGQDPSAAVAKVREQDAKIAADKKKATKTDSPQP